MTKAEAYDILLYWVERYIDYNLMVPEDYVDEDGNPSDAVTLKECLEALPKRWPKQHKPKPKPDPKKMTYAEWLNNPDFKDYIYTIRNEARESINPHWRYCVCPDNIDECWVTDDIGDAMEFAASKSRDGSIWEVFSIENSGDGWRLMKEGFCANGHYIESKMEYLHFDYVEQRCGGVKKI